MTHPNVFINPHIFFTIQKRSSETFAGFFSFYYALTRSCLKRLPCEKSGHIVWKQKQSAIPHEIGIHFDRGWDRAATISITQN